MASIVKSLPAAARTFKAISDFGYDLNSAIADILDNSVSRGKACNIEIVFHKDKSGKFFIVIYDDGIGMKQAKLEESMRVGSAGEYDKGDLSKYGMGMKTASLSQCNRLTVLSKFARTGVSAYEWNMHHVHKTDKWDLLKLSSSDIKSVATSTKGRFTEKSSKEFKQLFERKSWTMVIWEDLKHFQNDYNSYVTITASDNYFHRTLDNISLNIGLIFGRYITGENKLKKVNIFLNGKKIKAFDPFCRSEANTKEMALSQRNGHFIVDSELPPIVIKRYILPAKNGSQGFSSEASWNAAKGPKSWNDAQGYYVYRNNRLIKYGGWFGTKSKDEHDKLARVSIDVTDEHDELFTLDVKKTRIQFPELLKNHLSDHVNKGFIKAAKQRYNKDRPKAQVSNAIRDKSILVQKLADELISHDKITINEARGGNALVINNNSGTTITDDLTYRTIESGLKIVSGKINDKSFWKMIPVPGNKFQVLINESHPFYDEVYGNHERDRKITAIMDAFLFTMSFVELKCITRNNELLFEQIREVASSVLEKFVKEKVL